MRGPYILSDDKERFDLERVMELLQELSWSKSYNKERLKRGIGGSDAYGVYTQERLIGFARVMNDGGTSFFLMDVVIDPVYRGQGLGRWMMESILELEKYRKMHGFLVTDSAEGLYRKFGFIQPGEETHAMFRRAINDKE